MLIHWFAYIWTLATLDGMREESDTGEKTQPRKNPKNRR